MTQRERQRQLRIVAEILLVHLPDRLAADQPLAHDLMAVVATALTAVAEDAERSALAWDKRAYHLRADEMRRTWAWAEAAAAYAADLALDERPLQMIDIVKLRRLIRPPLTRPARRQIGEPNRFRGAAAALARQRERKRHRPVLREPF